MFKNNIFQINLSFVRIILSTLILVIIIAACGLPFGIQQNGSIQATELPFPNADYYSIINIDKTVIALTSGEHVDNQWWYAMQGDQNLHLITLPDDSSCVNTAYVVPSLYSMGTLQFWKLCMVGTKDLITKTITSLVIYDWKTGQIQEIAGPVPLGSAEVSWNPDETRGIVYLSDAFASGTLYWIQKGSVGPLDMIVGDQNHSWNMKDDYPDFQGTDKAASGDAGRADWSPDGHTIAFFGSPDAVGMTGGSRFSVEYKIFLVDPDQLKPKAVLDKIYFPYNIRWSPDSKHIAFIGQYGLLKQDGIWLYTIGSNSAVKIAAGYFQDMLWTADGNSLITIYCKKLNSCSQIEEYDLTSLMRP